MNFAGINKLSLLDYPGKVAIILYTKGCNFRCPFCHNGLTLLDNSAPEIPFEEILEILNKRKGVVDGVVITGGEPTLMPDLVEKIQIIKEIGYLVKLDTNGTNPDVIEELIRLNLIDYVAMDVKNSVSKYDLTTNSKVNTINILKSIKLIQNSGLPYEFRTTLVAEFHDEKEIDSMGKMLEGSAQLFLQKFKLSDGVINKNLHPVDEDLANKFKEILSKYITSVVIRGY